MINKKLQRKWFNFTHPTKIEHYGYAFSDKDLRQFPEGRAVLFDIAKIKLGKRRLEKLIQPLSERYNKMMDKLVLDCMEYELRRKR